MLSERKDAAPGELPPFVVAQIDQQFGALFIEQTANRLAHKRAAFAQRNLAAEIHHCYGARIPKSALQTHIFTLNFLALLFLVMLSKLSAALSDLAFSISGFLMWRGVLPVLPVGGGTGRR